MKSCFIPLLDPSGSQGLIVPALSMLTLNKDLISPSACGTEVKEFVQRRGRVLSPVHTVEGILSMTWE